MPRTYRCSQKERLISDTPEVNRTPTLSKRTSNYKYFRSQQSNPTLKENVLLDSEIHNAFF